MKIGFLTDSTCDLPASILRDHNVHILPIMVTCEHRLVMDNKKAQPYQRIINLLRRGLKASSEPYSVDEIKQYFINLLSTYDYDYLICVMPMESRSESYLRTLDASIAARSEIRKKRLEKGWKPTVEIEVINSSQISTGLGIILLNTIKTYEKYRDFKHTIDISHKITKYVQTYVLPNDLEYLYKHGAGNGDDSVGFGSYILGTALDMKPIFFINNNHSEAIAKVKGYNNGVNQILSMLMRHIEQNTIIGNVINISFGNSLEDLKKYPKYQEFYNLAEKHEITVLLSNMSATLNVNVGLNSLSVAFLSNKVIQNFK